MPKNCLNYKASLDYKLVCLVRINFAIILIFYEVNLSIQVSGKNIEVGESLQKFAAEALHTCIEKYMGDFSEGHVVLSKDGTNFCADISVHLAKHMNIHCHAVHPDAYQSVADSISKVKSKLQKYKNMLRDRTHGERSYIREEHIVKQYVLDSHTEPSPTDATPIIIAEAKATIPSFSVSDAVMHMELANAQHFLFLNAKNKKTNLVYRRPDGHIGWIDPT